MESGIVAGARLLASAHNTHTRTRAHARTHSHTHTYPHTKGPPRAHPESRPPAAPATCAPRSSAACMAVSAAHQRTPVSPRRCRGEVCRGMPSAGGRGPSLQHSIALHASVSRSGAGRTSQQWGTGMQALLVLPQLMRPCPCPMSLRSTGLHPH